MSSMKMGILAAGFATLATSGSARAECKVASDNVGGECEGALERLYVDADVYLDIKGNKSLLAPGCNAVSGKYLKIVASDPRLDQFVSLALAAKLSGKPITVRVHPSADGKKECLVSYIVMD